MAFEKAYPLQMQQQNDTTNKTSGTSESIILIKAAPQVGQKHGETVCCAGIGLDGNWQRLYPISFEKLEVNQRFRRWDRIDFKWRLPHDDRRIESLRIDQQSIRIVGRLKDSEKQNFLHDSIVTSLKKEYDKGKSLALLKPEIEKFDIVEKSESEIVEETKKFSQFRSQLDLFGVTNGSKYLPCPYKFQYKYICEDGKRTGTCQDWEIEATFFNWERQYGRTNALNMIQNTFGNEYPQKGMLLAMGTHSMYPNTWLINGVIRLDEIKQLKLI